MASKLDSDAQRVVEEFLAERARKRAAMIEEAGFPAPIGSPPPVLSDEDRLAAEILIRLNDGLPTTADERQYIHRKLFAVPGRDEYVPAPIGVMPSRDKVLLSARLMAIDHAARSAAG